MADVSGGAIRWVLDVEDGGANVKLTRFRQTVKDTGDDIEKTERKVRSSFTGFASDASASFGSIADGLGLVLKGVAAIGVTGSVGLGAMTKAAFDQVRQVENATFALRAYESDVGKVNQVLGELISFARSDLGVLFQREELFKAASNLRGFGEETGRITERVRILARGVSLGMTTFDELSQIIGRATQSGRLNAEAFDQLAFRGIILDSSFRGATVSADQLYGELQRVLPASLLEDRANTIDGAFIRLQSAFRDLGSSILGVDKNTSKFIKGGLGDRFIGLLRTLRDTLASPELKSSLGQLGQAIAGFAERAIPAIVGAFIFLVNNRETVGAFFAALVAGFVAAKVAAIAFGVATLATNPFLLALKLISVGVVAVVAAITFLEVRFGVFSTAFSSVAAAISTTIDVIKSVVQSGFEFVYQFIVQPLQRAVGSVASLFRAIFGTISSIVGSIISVVRNAFNGVVNAITHPINEALNFVRNIGNAFVEAGKNIVNGIVRGINSAKDAVVNKVKEVSSGALNAVKGFFGIKSPSRVMAQMGGFLMQGFTKGIEAAGSGSIAAVRNVSNAISDQFVAAEGSFDARLMANVTSETSPVATSGSNGAVLNQTNNIYNQVDMDAGWRDLSWRLAN